ncbi:MAG: hypothetical protein GY711_25580 [bacterium]|nr:hypothetical protein [bacterium]
MKSLRARLLFGLLVGVTLLLAVNGFVIYAIVSNRLYGEVDRSLVALARSQVLTTSIDLGRKPRRARTSTPKFPFDGVAFGPWIDGQDPTKGATVPIEQLRERLQLIAGDAAAIRTYGVRGGLERAGELIHEMDRQAIIGAWINGDRDENEEEINKLIELARKGHVDVAVVGNEVLTRGDLPEEELLALIARVRAAVPEHIPVTTCDTPRHYLHNPSLISDVDFIFVNCHPYWDGVAIEGAIGSLACQYQTLVDIAHDKRVVIAEAGWPSAGGANDAAASSPENALRFLKEFIVWARLNDVQYCYFSSLDEAWKGGHGYPQEAHWGYRTADGSLKDGVQEVLTALEAKLPEPSLTIDEVPGRGSLEPLHGHVSSVGTSNHRVVVYIRVEGGWWSKPRFDSPLTAIECTCEWETEIITGANDDKADRIAAFLVPAGYAAPLLAGEPQIRKEVFEAALDSAEVER